MLWLKQYNYTELDISGIGLIMSDLGIEFKRESFYGDTLEINLYVGEITKKSFELYYDISTLRDLSRITVAKAKTGMVCFDYSIKKVSLIPEALMKLLIE
jgi:acyl-CoA thioesterase FadM